MSKSRLAKPADATRVLLRLPPAVHANVKRAASAAGLSINEYCLRRLRTPGPPLALHDDAQALVARATELLADRLVGLVMHGSFVRGEAHQSSDVDVLVVVAADVSLTRSLYRTWDAAPVTWDGRAVDCHFVHLPAGPARAGSVWCEAAIEGLVLLDWNGDVDAALRGVRTAVAAGRLVRKQVHGQPYWTKVA